MLFLKIKRIMGVLVVSLIAISFWNQFNIGLIQWVGKYIPSLFSESVCIGLVIFLS